jgi:RND family efflux transporter MFP subunit
MKHVFFTGLIILLAFVSFQCSGEGNASQKVNEKQGIPVEALILTPRPFSEYLQLTGTVTARNRVKIVAEENGLLKKIIRDKGNIVRAGDTLAIIENKILEASYKEAVAALNQAELDYGSKKVLYDKRAISENEYLAAKYGLERAQAAYELNKTRYSKLTIVSPLNGYVNDRFYDLGAFVMPMTPVFDFIDNAYMKINAGVAERFLQDIKIGTAVQVTFDAIPNLLLESEVSYINKSIDVESRTFQIEIKVPNPDRQLAPQMIANVRLLRRFFEDQIVIPLDAVIESEAGRYVFIVSENKTAQKVPVTLQAIYEDSVLVEGLHANDRLIVLGQQELTEGDQLILKQN